MLTIDFRRDVLLQEFKDVELVGWSRSHIKSAQRSNEVTRELVRVDQAVNIDSILKSIKCKDATFSRCWYVPAFYETHLTYSPSCGWEITSLGWSMWPEKMLRHLPGLSLAPSVLTLIGALRTHIAQLKSILCPALDPFFFHAYGQNLNSP